MNNSLRESTIAIDLGTTNCVSSYIGENREINIIPNKEGGLTTPTFIHVKPEGMKIKTEIGERAKEHLSDDPSNVLYSFKTHMGTKQVIKEIDVLGAMTSLHCSFLMLKYLKESAEEYLDRNITSAVVTVPAYFDESQKSATKIAAKMAGLEVSHIVNEPTAATFYYGLESKTEEPITILAYDLGGGTFDVSIIQVIGDQCVVIGTSGDNKLGGDDIDKVILEDILSKLKIRINKSDGDYEEKILRIAEKAKIELCDNINLRNKVDAEVEIKVPTKETQHDEEPEYMTTKLTRKEFETMLNPIVQRTMLCTEQAVNGSNIDISEIDEVILIGGSTRVPYIREGLVEYLADDRFDKEYFDSYQMDPDLAVGLGSGMFLLHLLENRLANLTDIVTKSVGVADSDGQLIPVLKVGRTLPATGTKVLFNAYDYQENFNLILFEGESNVAERNTNIGEIVIPIQPSPKGTTSVMIKCRMDTDGTLKIQALAGDQVKDITIQRGYEEDIDINLDNQNIKGFGK